MLVPRCAVVRVLGIGLNRTSPTKFSPMLQDSATNLRNSALGCHLGELPQRAGAPACILGEPPSSQCVRGDAASIEITGPSRLHCTIPPPIVPLAPRSPPTPSHLAGLPEEMLLGQLREDLGSVPHRENAQAILKRSHAHSPVSSAFLAAAVTLQASPEDI